MKRSADNSAGPAHNADTRLRKLKTDNSGRPILPVDKKKEKAEDKAKDAVTETLEGLAVTLENDPNGQGRELWNNPGVGHALQHLVKAVEARADKYHVRDDIDVAAERPGLAGIQELTSFADAPKFVLAFLSFLADFLLLPGLLRFFPA